VPFRFHVSFFVLCPSPSPQPVLCLQVFTLVAAAFMSGLLFAIFTFTPGRFETNDLIDLRSAALSTTNSTLNDLNAFAAAQQPPNAALAAEVAAQQKDFKGLGDSKKLWISNQGIINSLQEASQLQAAQLQP
jgi:hypothetical protein